MINRELALAFFTRAEACRISHTFAAPITTNMMPSTRLAEVLSINCWLSVRRVPLKLPHMPSIFQCSEEGNQRLNISITELAPKLGHFALDAFFENLGDPGIAFG